MITRPYPGPWPDAYGADESVAVLAANLTALVTVPLVEVGLLHGYLV